MIRPVLLTVLVVCSLGAPLVAAQPAAGDVLETPTPDGSDDPDRDDPDGSSADDGTYDGESHDDGDRSWYDRWGSDRENGTSDENRSADENDSEYWAEEDPEGDGAEDGPDGRDGNETADDGDSEPDGDRAENTTGDDHDANGTEEDRAREDDDTTEPERWKLTVNGTVYVLDGSGAVEHDVTDATAGAAERDGVLDGSPVLRESAAGDRDAVGAHPNVGSSPAAREDRGAAPARAGDDDVAGPADPSGVDAAEPASDDGTDDGPAGTGPASEGPAGEDPAGSSPAGAGAALFVTVGCLGGTRVAVTQANLLASPASEGTLASIRRAVGEHLSRLADGLLPAVFGYSRRDGSDPLENETRAAIYDLVRESPGTYHAKLAEETGVAVETVRYHSRILAEEGLVEAKKLRGRRRLFPVTMDDDDDPELAAAIADSAAADVLSAIDRLEPATLSAVADAVDCAPSTVAYHLDRLEEDGLVTRERDGGAVRLRLRRSTRSALQGRVADD